MQNITGEISSKMCGPAHQAENETTARTAGIERRSKTFSTDLLNNKPSISPRKIQFR